jgi:hypothetical protein
MMDDNVRGVRYEGRRGVGRARAIRAPAEAALEGGLGARAGGLRAKRLRILDCGLWIGNGGQLAGARVEEVYGYIFDFVLSREMKTKLCSWVFQKIKLADVLSYALVSMAIRVDWDGKKAVILAVENSHDLVGFRLPSFGLPHDGIGSETPLWLDGQFEKCRALPQFLVIWQHQFGLVQLVLFEMHYSTVGLGNHIIAEMAECYKHCNRQLGYFFHHSFIEIKTAATACLKIKNFVGTMRLPIVLGIRP